MLIFSSSKEIRIRRLVFVALALLTAAVQHTPGFTPSLGSLSPMLLVPFVVCVAMYERSMMGLAFGVLAGALWDIASSGADGMFTLMLAVIGFVTGTIITFYIRNRLFSAFVLTLLACLAVSVAYWMIFVLRKGFDGTWSILLTHFLPLALYSSLFVFVYYAIVGVIVKATSSSSATGHGRV